MGFIQAVFRDLLLHSAPEGGPQDSGEFLRMVDLPAAVGLVVVVGVVPVYAGLAHLYFTRKLSSGAKGLLAAAAFGAMVPYLVDAFKGASSLGIDMGSGAPIAQGMLVFIFAVGLLLPSLIGSKGEPSSTLLFAASNSYLFAFAIGLHGFGEGIVIGYDFLAGASFSLTHRVVQALSFFLHKAAEGFTVSIPLLFANKWGLSSVVYTGLIAGLPVVAGVFLGYLGVSGGVVPYSFAAAAGAAMFVLHHLSSMSSQSVRGRKLYASMLLGVLYMYMAGWLHGLVI